MASAPTPSAVLVRLLLTLVSVAGVCLAREHVFLNRLHEVLETSDTGIDSVCRQDTAVYLEQLRLGAPWALKMFDSSAKPHSGVLEGGLTFLGLYSECLEALPEGAAAPNLSVAQQFYSRYCLATLNLHDAQEEAPQGFPEYLWQELRANPRSPQFGLCVPSSCSPEDVTTMVGQFAKGFVDGAKATGSACSSPREPFLENVGALVVSAVLLAFALLVAVGTVYDLCNSYQGGRKKPSSFQSVETKVASSEGLVDDEDQKGYRLADITNRCPGGGVSASLHTGAAADRSVWPGSRRDTRPELVEHAWTTGHNFDFTAATTLAKEDRWGPRKLLESWFIRGDKTACNKNRGPLPEAYMDLPDK